MQEKYEEYQNLVFDKEVFPDPSPTQGLSYVKPSKLLGCCYCRPKLLERTGVSNMFLKWF